MNRNFRIMLVLFFFIFAGFGLCWSDDLDWDIEQRIKALEESIFQEKALLRLLNEKLTDSYRLLFQENELLQQQLNELRSARPGISRQRDGLAGQFSTATGGSSVYPPDAQQKKELQELEQQIILKKQLDRQGQAIAEKNREIEMLNQIIDKAYQCLDQTLYSYLNLESPAR